MTELEKLTELETLIELRKRTADLTQTFAEKGAEQLHLEMCDVMAELDEQIASEYLRAYNVPDRLISAIISNQRTEGADDATDEIVLYSLGT